MLAADVAEVEPNDDLAAATEVLQSGVLRGSFASLEDEDFFRIPLSTGDALYVDPAYADSQGGDRQPFVAFDLVDPSGAVQIPSIDIFRSIFVAAETGDHFLRVHTGNRFGLPNEDYAITATINRFDGIEESEPNNDSGQATPLPASRDFRGTLQNADDHDTFSFAAQAGQVVVLDLAGAVSPPTITLSDADGLILATDSLGQGIIAEVPEAGTYFFTLTLPSAQSSPTPYAGTLRTLDQTEIVAELGDRFENHSALWPVTASVSGRAGVLESLQDVDVYQIQGSGLESLRFDLRYSGTDDLSLAGRRLSLFNEWGQLIAYADASRFDYNHMPLLSTPGVYYLVIQATSSIGFGPYAISGAAIDTFADQRDVPLYFFDFTQQLPEHRGRTFDAAFEDPQNIPFLVSHFEATYDRYDVDVTTELPTDRWQYISQGVGVFEGQGNSGGGSFGFRTAIGSSIADSVRGFPTGNINHEIGHATTLNHARNPLQQVAWENFGKTLFPGTDFGFVTGEVATGVVANHVDQADWVLQSGSQIRRPVGDDSLIDLNAGLREMELEYASGPVYSVGADPHRVIAGDFDNDGIKDLVTVNRGDQTLSVLFGQDGGGLSPPTQLDTGPDAIFAGTALAADVNGDGFDDLVHANYVVDGTVDVFLGAADRQFVYAGGFSAGDRPGSIATGDFNRDGHPDLAVANYFTANVSILTGAGDGTFLLTETLETGGRRANEVELADLDNDGMTDLLVADGLGSRITSFLGRPDGSFAFGSAVGVPIHPQDLVFLDLNADAYPDVATISRETGRIERFVSDGDGGLQLFSLDPLESTPGVYAMEGADVNDDGKIDLVLPVQNASIVEILINLGEGRFSRPIQFDPGGDNEAGVFVTDWDADQRSDIWVVDSGSDTLRLMPQIENDRRNDRVVVHSSIDDASEIESYSLQVVAGETYAIDVDAAELQYPLDAGLIIVGPAGQVVAANESAMDRDTAIDSVDPYLVHTFEESGTYRIDVVSQFGTVGKYRLKVAPTDAFDNDGPRVRRASPQQDEVIDQTRQLLFWMNDTLDPQSINAQTIRVVGAATGPQLGNAVFDPLKNLLIWRGHQPLPPDTYTVTLDGLTDTRGNVLDGETNGLRFPSISGDGVPGGALPYSFTVDSLDITPAQVRQLIVTQSDYSSHVLDVRFDDPLDVIAAQRSRPIVTAAGPDGAFDTADDYRVPVDVYYQRDYDRSIEQGDYTVFTRGYLHPGWYKIRATLLDESGQTTVLDETFQIAPMSLRHGVSVVDMNFQPGQVQPAADREDIRWTFSNPVDPTTLTVDTVRVRYSQDAHFFDSQDLILQDADGSIEWDAATLTAIFQPATPLDEGFYLVELDGQAEGIRDSRGNLLDGEYLDSNINGTTVWSVYADRASGDGRRGGDYRAAFGIDRSQPSPLTLSFDRESISESGGTATLRITREDADGELRISLSNSDPSSLNVQTSVIIPDGKMSSDPITISAIDDPFVDGTQTVTLVAAAQLYSMTRGFVRYEGVRSLDVTDAEQLSVTFADPAISESGGTSTLTVTRTDPRGNLVVALNSDQPEQFQLPIIVTLFDGQLSSVPVAFQAIDDDQLEGPVTVQVTASGSGYQPGTSTIEILDHEPLELLLADATISEFGGETSLVVRRTDPRGDLVVDLAVAGADRIGVPTSLTIVDGALESAPVPIAAIDDLSVNAAETIEVTASAAGYLTATDSLVVADVLVLHPEDAGWDLDATWQFTGVIVRLDTLVWQYTRQGQDRQAAHPNGYSNPINRYDVNASGQVSAIDALVVINELARRAFSDDDPESQGTIRPLDQVVLESFQFFDVTGDDRITALDALQVINEIARRIESSRGSAESVIDSNTLFLSDFLAKPTSSSSQNDPPPIVFPRVVHDENEATWRPPMPAARSESDRTSAILNSEVALTDSDAGQADLDDASADRVQAIDEILTDGLVGTAW
ncbi:FG-GAP-like repeat-containing protein [Roseiconus nitratireducens]|nr:FG-GAP-like repeat-containing protein [Roseiconus nitratireducens]